MRRARTARPLGVVGVALLLAALLLAPSLASSPSARGAGARSAVHPLAGFTLSVTGTTPSAIALSWTSTGFLPTYTVQESTNGSGGPFTSVAVISNGATTYAQAGLSPATTYWWEVTETGTFGSATSNVLAVTQPEVAALTEWAVSGTALQFNWTNNATYGGGLAFVSYVLFESVGGHPATAAVTVGNVSTLTTSLSGLSPGSSYTFFLNTTDCWTGCPPPAGSTTVSESNALTFGAPLPLSASIGAQRPTVDVGQLDLFTCTPSGGQNPYTFAWDWGNGTYVPGGGATAHAFSVATSVTVTCRVTDNLSSQYPTATTIVVTSDPTLTASANRTAADIDQAISFNCSGSGGFAPYSIGWTFGDGGAASTSEPSHTYTTAGTFRAICTLTDGTSTQVAANVTLDVSPQLTLTAMASASAAAPGTSLTFTAAPVNGSGVYPTISWSFGDGGSASGLVVHHLFATASVFHVLANATDSNGGRASASVPVTVAALAVALPALPPTAVAPGASVTFVANASGGAGAPYNYTWTFGDGTLGYGANVTHRYASAGTFHVSLLVSDRLGATNRTTFAPLVVSTPPPPAPLLSALGLLALAAVIALVAFGLGFVLRRRRTEREFRAVAGRVPVTDTERMVRGSKVCRVCGTTNVGLRTTCEQCGASLRGAR